MDFHNSLMYWMKRHPILFGFSLSPANLQKKTHTHKWSFYSRNKLQSVSEMYSYFKIPVKEDSDKEREAAYSV